MITKKPVLNKFYKYSDTIVKLKKISKSSNKIFAERVDNGEAILIPYEQCEILLIRLYTVGEVAKIVEKRSDTLRKYEKKNLIPSPNKFGEKYQSYQSWRYYEESDIYEMIEFFNDRTPGRPVQKNNIDLNSKIKSIQEKVKLKF
jgi:hypothetical protein